MFSEMAPVIIIDAIDNKKKHKTRSPPPQIIIHPPRNKTKENPQETKKNRPSRKILGETTPPRNPSPPSCKIVALEIPGPVSFTAVMGSTILSGPLQKTERGSKTR